MATKKETEKPQAPLAVDGPHVLVQASGAIPDNLRLDEFASFISKHTHAEVHAVDAAALDAVMFASVPTTGGGTRIESLKPILDAFRTRPERRKGTATLETLSAFVMHFNRFKDANSVIYATEGKNNGTRVPKLISVLDYNEQGPDGLPRFGGHRGVYNFPVSEQWEKWNEMDGETMNTREFAEFIEDRIMDVIDPPSTLDEKLATIAKQIGTAKFASASRLMELSRGMQVNITAQAKQIVNLNSGEGSISFVEEHSGEGGKKLDVPNLFLISIPVFNSGVPYRMPVRLRYRVAQGGAIIWSYSMFQPDLAFLHAFNEAAALCAKDTDAPVIFGTPEA